MTPTTEFDHLMKYAFRILYPNGSSQNYFKAEPGDDCYLKAVKPDYVIPKRAWIDFKYRVSYEEKYDAPWRPSALYASLRKYIDHIDNPDKRLIILYGKLYGSIGQVKFPIMRGHKILIKNAAEFQARIKLVPALQVVEKLRGTEHQWVYDKVVRMTRGSHSAETYNTSKD